MALFITMAICFTIFGLSVGMALMWRWTHAEEVTADDQPWILNFEAEVERRRA